MTDAILENRMLTRLDVEGFRGLKQFSLEEAGRINLIVGRNDAGKTSLLEAMRLLLTGDPRYLRRTARNRMQRRPSDTEQDYRLAFTRTQNNAPLRISGIIGSFTLSAQAEILKMQQEENVPIDLESEEDDANESLLQPTYEAVVTVRASNSAVSIIRQPLLLSSTGDSGIKFYRSRRETAGLRFPDIPSLVWLGTNRHEVWAAARRYSDLYRSGGSARLIDILKEIEPRLISLVILTNQEARLSSTVLEVDLGFPTTLPLENMGDGFSSVISILSAVGAAKNGICLIDEMENGIHYSLLPQVWRSTASAVEEYNAQVWATTHSYDCIAAAYEGLADRPDALRVHRLERKADGIVAVHTFDYAMLGRALQSGLEVR